MKMIKKALNITVALFCIAGFAYGQSINDVRKAIEVEQYEKAKAMLSKLASNPATTAESYYYMGDVYVKTLEFDSAQVFFDKGVAANPQFGLNYVGQGKLSILKKNFVSAKPLFDKAIALGQKEKDYRPYLETAKAYALAGEEGDAASIETAIAYIEQAKKIASKNPEVYTTLGNAYLLKKDGNNAIANYNKALELDKNYVAAYVAQSHIYRGAQNYESSLAPLEKAISIDPNYAPAYRELAELYAVSGQYAKATETYKNKYLPLTDASCNSNTRYASVLFLAKQYQSAYDQINLLLKTCQVKPVMYRLLAYSAYEIKKPTEALEAMNTFFQKQPESNVITQDYEYMAKILSDNKKDSLAIAYMQKALVKDPSKIDLYPLLGKMSYLSKQYPTAIKAYDSYFAIPNVKKQPVDYLYYGLSAMRVENYKKADSAFLKVTELSPTYIQGYLYRGQANAAQDKDSKLGLAKPYYEKVVELGEADKQKNAKYLIEAYDYLGSYAYLVQNDLTAAKSFYNKVIEIDPANQKALEVIKGLNTTGGKNKK
ncbi:tetratricopeptide repeat protein [Solitalea lacus]|uniref:tetratricopeptide repeat protein n=1 Tax=Solitalea lacus TaxID=2911172 RepID=UPI001EDA1904|nr:tetratricopeptide repeat protein [Solitalea lacus]UKJ07722.1 tetratricopeptide repeat protein [Solitalea lacus]